MGTDAAIALQLLRAKQNAYYIQAVQDALQSEELRKQKLHKASNKQEAKRLETQFTRERSADRERLRHIQEDHALLLNTKIAEWKTTGGVKTKQAPEAVASKQRTEHQTAPHKVNFTKDSMERLAAPRVTTIKPELAGAQSYELLRWKNDRHSTFNSRGGIESTQALEFYKNVYRKQDRERLSRNAPPPQTLTTTNLRTMSETELLRKKANLLSELHGVVSLEARLIQDDQCTVRSSVSSWKSAGCT
ncbi:hypothetical protein P3T76_004832 [Phytophthora citrophthora]|uniref:Uncharacterized protein n=1 Tax=Phytophthora citrophthora TaxID=4793 RepID=A0AAD9GS08_9STRA|nr:hypothetical protein P3T76_004832 [Phytophthora citrophthora]